MSMPTGPAMSLLHIETGGLNNRKSSIGLLAKNFESIAKLEAKSRLLINNSVRSNDSLIGKSIRGHAVYMMG